MAAFRIAYGASQHEAVKSDRGFAIAKITFDESLIFVCFLIKPEARKKNKPTDFPMLESEETVNPAIDR